MSDQKKTMIRFNQYLIREVKEPARFLRLYALLEEMMATGKIDKSSPSANDFLDLYDQFLLRETNPGLS